MNAIEQPIVDFFLGLQRSVNAVDVPAIARAFSAQLLEATPAGTRTFENDDRFRAVIDQWLALLGRAGIRDAKALQIDPTPLSTEYALVRVRWSIWFTPEDCSDFVEEFLVDYLVRLTADGMKITASIAHDDDASIMQRIGLAE